MGENKRIRRIYTESFQHWLMKKETPINTEGKKRKVEAKKNWICSREGTNYENQVSLAIIMDLLK